MNGKKWILTEFATWLIIGFFAAVIIFCIVCGIYFNRVKEKELIEYAQRQQVIEELREDYVNRDPYEFIETLPGVSGAVDGAAADFLRKRDEALQRLRGGFAD